MVTKDADVFTATVYPVIERYARSVLRGDDELVSITLVIAWWMWFNRKQDFAAGHWARLAVRHARSGRDLPKCGTRKRDALRHAVSGCGMNELSDRKPGPVRTAEGRELLAMLMETLTESEQLMVEMLTSGEKAVKVAHATGISPGRVTQVRQALMDRLTNLE